MSTRAASRTEAKATKSNPKTMRIVTGRMSVKRARARARFSNWPPHVTITGRQRHGRGDFGLGLGNEPALVAVPNVRPHGDLPFVLAAADDARAAHGLDARKVTQRHAATARGRHENLADRCRIRPRLREVSYRHVESALALEHGAHRAASDRELDHILDVADIHCVPGKLAAIDRNP
jgi:hypothetical protein